MHAVDSSETRPKKQGFFLWMELPSKGVDTKELLQQAKASCGVSFSPGECEMEIPLCALWGKFPSLTFQRLQGHGSCRKGSNPRR